MPFPPLRFHGTSSVLRHHPPSCRLPPISFPYTKALLASPMGWVSEDFPSSVPFCLTMSSLILRRCHQPSVRNGLFSDSSLDDADFVHEIGTRPPQSSLRSYQCVHVPARRSAFRHAGVLLRPGHLRSTLSGYPAMAGSSRLACNRFSSHTDFSLRACTP